MRYKPGIWIGLLAVTLIASPLLAQEKGRGKGKGKQRQEQKEVPEGKEAAKKALESVSDRGRGEGKLPPGLEQYKEKHPGKLPPGLQKQLEEKKHLPPGLEKATGQVSPGSKKGGKAKKEKPPKKSKPLS